MGSANLTVMVNRTAVLAHHLFHHPREADLVNRRCQCYSANCVRKTVYGFDLSRIS
jgi:hypothetical protein